ncbi:hypothetical protein VUR80DRAFT_10126 [Thermomyces stellatus]
MSDHCARKRELENWWKAEENSQAALDIQCLVLRAIYELWGCIGKNPAAAQRCREILAKPLEKFRTTLTSIRENPTHNMSPDATQTQWTGPRKQQFHDFVAMSWAYHGVEILWGPVRDFLPFQYNVKVLRTIPYYVNPTQPPTRVIVPKWKIETINVPLDPDW